MAVPLPRSAPFGATQGGCIKELLQRPAGAHIHRLFSGGEHPHPRHGDKSWSLQQEVTAPGLS